MKKTFLFAVITVFLSAPLAFSQAKINVDKNSFLKKIEKSDADIANPKKAANASTWINRGKLFYEAGTAVSSKLFEGLNEVTAGIMFGQPTAREEVYVGQEPMVKLTYPYMIAYVDQGGNFRAWEITYVVYENAIEKSIEAYNKAYELDPAKSAPKIAEGLKDDYDVLYKDGSIYFVLGKYAEAAKYFQRAYEVSRLPGFGASESQENIASLAHDTGVAYLFAPDYNKSVEYLTLAEKMGYKRDGEIYYLIYHAYKGLAPNNERDVMLKAKAILEDGMSQFPENANIIECMTDVYVALGEDPKGIIPVVEAAIAKDPGNPSLWNGLGRVYERLGETDKSIEAFEHVAELMPNNFNAHYSVGILYLRKGDAMNDEVNRDNSISTQAQLDEAMEKVNEVYRKAIAPLEKAHELEPDEPITIELLKNVTFRLREDAGMMEKHNKYNALFQQIGN